MGIMMGRRRQDEQLRAAKIHEVNRVKAHEKNNAAALKKYGTPAENDKPKAVPSGAQPSSAK